jgi:peptidoglycan-associated lipoprotein
MLAAAPQARIVLEGHVALSGPPADHADLAGRRALAVADYLAARGIEAGRMDLISWGSSQPAAGGTGTQALSRRVVIRAAD